MPEPIDLTHYEFWTEDELRLRHEKLVALSFEMLGLVRALAWHAAAE